MEWKEATDLDGERRRRNIRLYVYRLYEVRNWLAECLSDVNVPPPIELEEGLRSGVLLAKLGNYFAPHLVAKEKIFDANESRLNEEGFHYRHTDNINLWRKACLSLGLKEIIIPDPLDVYTGRNTRTIFALIALANHLYRLGKSPPIRDQAKNIEFTDAIYQAVEPKIDALDEFIMEFADENENEMVGIAPDTKNLLQESSSTVDEFNDCLTAQGSGKPISEISVSEDLKNVEDDRTRFDLLNSDELSIKDVKCLIDMEADASLIYHEEICLEMLKIEMQQLIEKNINLDHQLHESEEKIALLVRNFRNPIDEFDSKTSKRPNDSIIEAYERVKERSEDKRFLDSLGMILYYLRINSEYMAHLSRVVGSRRSIHDFFKHFGQLYYYGHRPIDELSVMALVRHVFCCDIRKKRSQFSLEPEQFPFYGLTDEITIWIPGLQPKFSSNMIDTLLGLLKNPLPAGMTGKLLENMLSSTLTDPQAQLVADNFRNCFAKWAVEIANAFISSTQLPISIEFLLKELSDELSNYFSKDRVLFHGRTLIYELCLAPYLRQAKLAATILDVDINSIDNIQLNVLNVVESLLKHAAFDQEFDDDLFGAFNPSVHAIGQDLEEMVKFYFTKNENKPATLLYGLGHYAQLLDLPTCFIRVSKDTIFYVTDILTSFASQVSSGRDFQFIDLLNDLILPSDEKMAIWPEFVELVLRPFPDTRLNESRLAADIVLETKSLIVDLLKLNVKGDSIMELTDSDELDEKCDVIAQKQLRLRSNLTILTERKISDEKTGFADLLQKIGQDIGTSCQRKDACLEQIHDLKSVINYNEKLKNEMISRINIYKQYERECKDRMVGRPPSIALNSDDCKKIKKFIRGKEKLASKKDSITLNAEKMIRKRLLFMDDPTVPKQLSKYSVRISPGNEVGTYLIECFLSGKLQTSKLIDFQNLLRLEDRAEIRLPFEGPVVFHCMELRKYLDKKYHFRFSPNISSP